MLSITWRRLRYRVRALRRRVSYLFPSVGKQRAHYLHIGKTGGTALIEALRPVRNDGIYKLHTHPHATKVAHLPRGEPFFFTVRDPISRYVSGFYSRQRCGRPRYNVEWTAGEKEAFERFRTANELAEAIGTSAGDAAMRSIGHVRSFQADWLGDPADWDLHRSNCLFVARQESLERDFTLLVQLLGLPSTLGLSTDDVTAHRNPATVDRRLSQTALANLHEWYQRDFAFIDAWGGDYPGHGDAVSSAPTPPTAP